MDMNAKFWPSNSKGSYYPEVKLPEIQARPNTGLCFSGGGSRSLSASIGQLRGLFSLNLLSSTRYISCVSGGSWASVPFTFLPNKIKDETFLGPLLTPSELSPTQLGELDPLCHLSTLLKPKIAQKYFDELMHCFGSESYARALNEIFLSPYELDNLQKLFSWNNPQSSLFYSVEHERPYLIAGGTLLSADNPDIKLQRSPFEFTPIYTGISSFFSNVTSGHDVGGGYLESFAFNCSVNEFSTKSDEAFVNCSESRDKLPFTLCDVIGSSGAAPELLADRFHILGKDWPSYYNWPVSSQDLSRAGNFQIGDGGILENNGILPLLKRKVEQIVVFVNTATSLVPVQKGDLWTGIDGYLPPLFGFFSDFWKHQLDTGKKNIPPYTQVFSNEQFASLAQGLSEAKEKGGSVIYSDTYKVLDNLYLGIEGNWDVEVLWVYNETVPKWISQLPSETQSLLKNNIFLKDFPLYKTFGQDLTGVINLSATQSNLLAHLSCWNVTSNASLFQSMLKDG